jgi:CrcB protein
MPDDHRSATAASFLLVAVGGFAGATLRHAVELLAPSLLATLAVNVVGSLLLGVVVYERRFLGSLSEPLRVAVVTGFLASLTTYSTFAVDTATVAPLLAVGNVAANYALGLTGVFVGRALAARLPGATVPEGHPDPDQPTADGGDAS